MADDRKTDRTHHIYHVIAERIAGTRFGTKRFFHSGLQRMARFGKSEFAFQPSIDDTAGIVNALHTGRIKQRDISIHQLFPYFTDRFVFRTVWQDIAAKVIEGNFSCPRFPPRLESEVYLVNQVIGRKGLDVEHMLLADTIAHGKQGIAMTPHGFLTAETGNVGIILLSLRADHRFHHREMVGHVLYQELGRTEFQGIFFIVAKYLFKLHTVVTGMI